jgi:superkiller protein 3
MDEPGAPSDVRADAPAVEKTVDQTSTQELDAPLSVDDEMAEINKLLEQDPDDFQAQCRLGELYFAKGMLEEAETTVSKAIETAENIRTQMAQSLAMYYSNLGTIQATRSKLEDAMGQFKKALELNARDVLALFNLGRAMYDRDQYMEAMPLYERLIEVTPDDPIAWFQLARVYEKLDLRNISDLHTIDAAIAAYRRVLDLDPQKLEAAFALMEVYMNLQKPDEAISVMETAVENNPDEPLAYYNLITTYEKTRRFAEADKTRERLKSRFASRKPSESKGK